MSKDKEDLKEQVIKVRLFMGNNKEELEDDWQAPDMVNDLPF